MKRYFNAILKILIVGGFCLPLFLASSEPLKTLPVQDLIKALQAGGHIIYMRHGLTDITKKDKNRGSSVDCFYERNLSEEGQDQAKNIGRMIRKLKIPIGKVFSSPYCRTKDTANLAFGTFQIEEDLQFSISKNSQEAKELGERLHSMMLDLEVSKDNQVLVGHTANLKDGLGVWPKPEGVIAVFKKHHGKIVFRGMIKPSEWQHEH